MVKAHHNWTARQIRELRAAAKAKKRTQSACAEFVGVSVRQWNNWERDKRTPSVAAAKLLEQLAKKVGYVRQ